MNGSNFEQRMARQFSYRAKQNVAKDCLLHVVNLKSAHGIVWVDKEFRLNRGLVKRFTNSPTLVLRLSINRAGCEILRGGHAGIGRNSPTANQLRLFKRDLEFTFLPEETTAAADWFASVVPHWHLDDIPMDKSLDGHATNLGLRGYLWTRLASEAYDGCKQS